MSAAIEDSNLLINRARAIAAMGGVERDYEGFNVYSSGIRKEKFRIWRDEDGRVRCSCPEFEQRAAEEIRFRCEHILAVKFHLEPQNETGEEHIEEPSLESQEESAQDEQAQMPFLAPAPFAGMLKQLSEAVSPEIVKQRVGWTDRAGREHEVDYVEWHKVADLLDRICPDWSHEVTDVKQIGDFVAVTASITIRGVRRQGVGTGSAYDEVGIKKAEHDALKRAAVKFGIARELYRKEDEEVIHKNGNTASGHQPAFPRDAIAKTMADLVTPKQLVAIRAISNVKGVNAEAECLAVLECRPEELSRRAASAFIDHLKALAEDRTEIRHAG